jgi:chorismate dehydratase
MRKVKIAAVSYINTWPFLEGLKRFHLLDNIELLLVPPSQCADLFQKGKVDIALSPIGTLPDAPPHKIITDYGIGCDGAVRTVAVLSQVDMDDIVSVQLDPDSRTSNMLVQVLARKYWKKDWHFFYSQDEDTFQSNPYCARIAIGDKVFALESEFHFRWDLGAAWKEFSNLPFVFAVWISRPDFSVAAEKELNDAFRRGVQSIDEMDLSASHRTYLKENISYLLDNRKQKSLSRFLDMVKLLNFQYTT